MNPVCQTAKITVFPVIEIAPPHSFGDIDNQAISGLPPASP
jgi:hypothetical protein